VDTYDEISGINLPRGKGGVSISWPCDITHIVKKIDEGHERIVAIEINADTKICIICVYMPTHNTSVQSIDEYAINCLDILFNIISNYAGTHKIIIAGDLNATLLISRKYNKHYKILMKVISDMNLHVINSNKSTYHHAGGSQSQIDYILSSDHELLYNYEIHEKNAINTSSHTNANATINIQMSRKPKSDTKNEKIYTKLWSKCDTDFYQQELRNLKSIIKPNSSSEVKLDILMKQPKKADEIDVPNKIIKLQGPKWKASPEVRPLIQDEKYKHKVWVDHGKPNDKLRNDQIKAQRKLRKQMRKEK
jgi:hypothetical protein